MSPIYLDHWVTYCAWTTFPLCAIIDLPQREKGEMSLLLSFLSFLARARRSPLALWIIVYLCHSMNVYASYHLPKSQRKERTLR